MVIVKWEPRLGQQMGFKLMVMYVIVEKASLTVKEKENLLEI